MLNHRPLRLASLVALIGFLLPVPAIRADPPGCVHGVVRLPSHGASATVIHTEPGKSYLLSCAHAFLGNERTKPIVLDAPARKRLAPQQVGIQIVDIDYETHLSLLFLPAGPLDFVCPVAPAGIQPARLLSVGYDEMRLPAHVLPAHVVQVSAEVTYTKERPGHGRSGGALIDSDHGYLVGVVQGYELDGPRRGIYVSHQAILSFLARPPAAHPFPPLCPPGRT
jgi:hypothetical protein